MYQRHFRIRRALAVMSAAASCAAALSTAAGAPAASAKSSTVSLSGVTLTFGDQLKEYQTIFAATGALKGAAYTVNWTDFIGGPPVIAAETGGSVDLGDMAETPTIFAQAAGDPVKVVAVTKGANPKVSPFDILVPASSSIKNVSQLRGKTIAVQEGTVEQYFLIQALKKAGIPYSAVTIENLAVTDASTAVTNGKVEAAVVSQPLTGLDLAGGKVRDLVNGAGYLQTFGYLTASQAALNNPQKAAAIADFINRFYKAAASLRTDPLLAAQTYVKTYGVALAVAKEAVASAQSVGTPITPSIISYQQTEANAFQRLGLISSTLNVKGVFDLPFNKTVATEAGLKAS
jgi:sulfonate transport system substrate-binding protein